MIWHDDVNGTAAGQGKKRGRRLRSLQNIRALLAHTLRQIEADTSLKPGEKYRLLVSGASELARVIEQLREHGDVEEQLADLEARYSRLLQERGLAT